MDKLRKMKTMKNSFLLMRKNTFIGLAASSLLLLGVYAYADNANVIIVSGQATPINDAITAQVKTVVELTIAADDNIITLRGKIGNLNGKRGEFSLMLLGANTDNAGAKEGKALGNLTLRANDLKLPGDDTVYPDALIGLYSPMFSGSSVQYYVRPNLNFYTDDARAERIKNWNSFPAASEHEFTLELRSDESGKTWVYLDGNVVSEYAIPAVGKVRVTLSPGAVVQDLSAVKSTFTPLLPLPVQEHSRGQGMENAQITFNDSKMLPGVFQDLTGEIKGIDVGGLGVIPVRSSDLQSLYFHRSAADNLPEQRLFSVPQATYSDAYILCAAEITPAKMKSFTLRVTRYGKSRGNAMADTIVRIPGDNAKDSDVARRVGMVEFGASDARRKATLWLLKVPIKNGLIQDILYDDNSKAQGMGTSKYLDVELMDPLYHVDEADAFPPPMGVTERGYRPTDPKTTGYDFYHTATPPAQTSGVHVFGLALEKSPAQMQVRSNIGIQEFYSSDKPQFNAEVTAEKTGVYSVKWEYADVDGKIVNSGSKSAQINAGDKSTFSIVVNANNGWYAARFILSNDKEELVDYRTTFVMLPPDTRKAGLESPFYGWWFGTNHGDQITLDQIGPILKRLGIRRAVGSGNLQFPESESLPKYGFTNSTVPWTPKDQGRHTMADFMNGTKTLQEAIATQEAAIRETLKMWPSIDRMLVFHESGSKGLPFPSEIWHVPPSPSDAKTNETWDKQMQYLEAMAQMVREKFPQLKLQYGNSGNSMEIIGELFRRKFPRQYIDTIASEDLGQTIAPERDTLGSTQDGWYLRELAKKMGYGDVPVTATTEWIGRMVEGSRPHGLREQAEWKVRDGLLALAYGYDTISIAGINDASDAYYYSIYANGGLNYRYPLMAPKPAYAAIATLTQVLDKAKFVRFIPTGSTVCYLAEFQRGDDWVYALWTPRGERELHLLFDNDASRSLTDLYGHESTVTGKSVALQASTAVQYLVSKSKLVNASAGKSTFTADLATVPEKPLQTIALDSANNISIVDDKTREGKTDIAYSSERKMIEGKATLREVDDPQMGKCMEVELQPNPALSGDLSLSQIEYITLKFSKPMSTKAKNAGIWIKGNGSWGAVDILKSGWGPWADNDNLNRSWSGDATINFDGWNIIKYPYYDWLRDKPDDATTITGLRITFPRTTLVGTDRVPIKNQIIRIKKIDLW
jgi:hypothetical protein